MERLRPRQGFDRRGPVFSGRVQTSISGPAEGRLFCHAVQIWERTRLATSKHLVDNLRVTTKEVRIDIANRLPQDATLADAAYELELRAAILEGIESLDRGQGVPLEEVDQMLPKWVSK